jgi:hypothetical protein
MLVGNRDRERSSTRHRVATCVGVAVGVLMPAVSFASAVGLSGRFQPFPAVGLAIRGAGQDLSSPIEHVYGLVAGKDRRFPVWAGPRTA